MGLIANLLGLSRAGRNLGQAVGGVAEVFVPNATKKMQGEQAAYRLALSQFEEEFKGGRNGWFDSFINGVNRLPRPAMAIGTLGLFAYAMISPQHFSERMQGLALVPDQLWWLLGAIISFYFGAREMYHKRRGAGIPKSPPFQASSLNVPRTSGTNSPPAGNFEKSKDNAALADWQATQRR